MIINLNVKIKAGKRTPVQVEVYGTAVNEKTIEFANGETIREQAICDWLQSELTAALRKIEKIGDERQ